MADDLEGAVVRLGESLEGGAEPESTESSGPVRVRILWPALGFPATIAPRPGASGDPAKDGDATRCVTLLVLSNREYLPREEVARSLRYVAWTDRGRRTLPAGQGSFAAEEIYVIDGARKPGLALPGAKDSFSELITFGDAQGTRLIAANLANRVRDFYRAQGLAHLHEIRIAEGASARLPDGAYHLFWNNQSSGENAPSDEMKLLLEQFARPRRAKLGDLWKQQGSYLLEEYEYEYRPMHPFSGASVKGKRAEILHPLFVRRQPSDRLRVGHLTDTHVDVRADVYEQNLKRAGNKAVYNNWNTSFTKGYQGAKRDSDIILLTGDLVDYGRGHWGRDQVAGLQRDDLYHEDRNWFLFYDLLAAGEAYQVPVYTSLGNHDWRINPYPPFAIAGAPDPKLLIHDHKSYSTKEQREILALAHGPGVGRKFSYQVKAESKAQLVLEEPGSALKALAKLLTQTRTLDEPGSPVETTVESVAWYLFAINPFFDYSFVLPSRHQVLMLDWAEDEDLLFPIVVRGKEWPYMLWQVESASDPGPKAKRCLTTLQRKLVTHLLESPGSAKLIGIHTPPIGPYSDWMDHDLLQGRKTYTKEQLKNARGPTNYGTRRPDGTEVPWNGHPIFAIRPRSGDAGMETDYGSLTQSRDWLIKELADPKHGVRAVFSGHIHRNGLYAVHVGRKEQGALVAGEYLVRQVVPPAVRGAKPPAIVRTPDGFTGPLYVNTTSGGPRGHDKSRAPTEAERKSGGLTMDPGYARLDLSSDGTIQMVEFRSSLAAPGVQAGARERVLESILDEMGLGGGALDLESVIEEEEAPPGVSPAFEESSFDLPGAETAPEAEPEWLRALESEPAPVAVLEELESLEADPGTRILPGEPVPWSSETPELDPAVAAIAERVMAPDESATERTATERAGWTRCFSAAEVANVVKAFEENAAAARGDGNDRCSCIVMLNVALGRLLPLELKQNRARGSSDRKVQMAALTTETIEQAMQQLRDRGFAADPLVMNFLDRRNRTAGTLKPERLKGSVRDEVIKLSETAGCWYAYGMSIMDGYHSVLLLVDRRTDPAKIYWMDQFSGGLDTEVTNTLDERVTTRTQSWWQAVMDTKGKGYRTTLRVWPLQKPQASSGS